MIEIFFLCVSSFTLGFFLMDTIWIYKINKWIKENECEAIQTNENISKIEVVEK